MLQNERPVEFASCALTDTQQRYAQIEKEMLAVQYGLTRFHQYVYGQVVTVETDHKPYQVAASDLFELDGHSFLLVVDCYSKWRNVTELADTRTITVIWHLENMFCDFGIPQTLFSDNGAVVVPNSVTLRSECTCNIKSTLSAK